MTVPLFKQKKNACGPTSLRMILAYYGKDIKDTELIRMSGGIKNYGVLTIKLAEVARKLGFKTRCLSYNRKLAKGQAKIKTPDIQDILTNLKKRIPVIINVSASVLYKDMRYKRMGHFIVVTDYHNGIFKFNDPDDGKQHKIKENELLFSWFNNILNSSAYLLIVWPK